MRFNAIFGAAALAFAVPAVAAAQAADPAAAGSATTAATSAPAAVTSGLTVKDKTGVAIGQVTDVKADGAGKQVATIKMGADSFAVDTASLAVDNGAATINATQAEIKAMLPKKK